MDTTLPTKQRTSVELLKGAGVQLVKGSWGAAIAGVAGLVAGLSPVEWLALTGFSGWVTHAGYTYSQMVRWRRSVRDFWTKEAALCWTLSPAARVRPDKGWGRFDLRVENRSPFDWTLGGLDCEAWVGEYCVGRVRQTAPVTVTDRMQGPQGLKLVFEADQEALALACGLGTAVRVTLADTRVWVQRSHWHAKEEWRGFRVLDGYVMAEVIRDP